uniref:Transposase Tc1-like domain-containing protein n=1 Tax=Latimeria chalumnae TaxID=7897 RepID=H3A7M8_LATCH
SSKELAKDLRQMTNKNVFSRLVHYTLIKHGLHGQVAARNPLLRGNKEKRFKGAKKQNKTKHRTWSQNTWKQVLFSDEKKFELLGSSNNRGYVCRRKSKRYINDCLPTVKRGGGSIQVWGCILYYGVGNLYKIKGILNVARYKQILIHHTGLIGQNFIMRQDNDPKHTFDLVKKKKKKRY